MTDQSPLTSTKPSLQKSADLNTTEINNIGINTTQSQSINPYQSPTAVLHSADANGFEGETNASKWYQLSGRIGRLRYMAYAMLLTILTYVLLMVMMGVLVGVSDSLNENNIGGLFIAIYLPLLPLMFYTAIIYPKRRLHDLNQSGWWAVLMFIPLVNVIFSLYLLFAPGTIGPNRFGAPPRPNRAIHFIGALIIPFIGVALIGILAAIALPAYQNYVERSEQAASQGVYDSE